MTLYLLLILLTELKLEYFGIWIENFSEEREKLNKINDYIHYKLYINPLLLS